VWQEGDGKGRKAGVTLWDLATGRVRTTLPGHDYAGSLAISPDGKTLAQGAEGVRLYDLTTGRERATLPGEARRWINSLAFAPDGRTLAGADYQGTVTLWDVATGKVKGRLEHGPDGRVCGLAFSPDGATLAVAVGSRGREIEAREVALWDPAALRRRLTLWGHKGQVLSVAFSPDGKLLASGGADNAVRLWDVAPADPK
jgi:WD40 repeat protein